MVIKRIHKNDSEYPLHLQSLLGESAPESIATLGNFELLLHPTLAIFGSSTCPAEIVSQTDQMMQKIVGADMTVIGGFHSDIEKRCLKILLGGDRPIVISPARSLDKLRIRPEYKDPLANGRLLFLSFFRSHRHRSDAEMAFKRNMYIAALAGRVLVVHAAPSSKTEQLCRELITWRKPVYTIGNEANQNLVKLGAEQLDSKMFVK